MDKYGESGFTVLLLTLEKVAERESFNPRGI